MICFLLTAYYFYWLFIYIVPIAETFAYVIFKKILSIEIFIYSINKRVHMEIFFINILVLWKDCDSDSGDENLQSWEFIGWAPWEFTDP